MAVSPALWITRLTLAPGVRTPVCCPRSAQALSLGNGTAGDLQVYSHNGETDDSDHYLVIAAGYERSITVAKSVFAERVIACWLESAAGGLVVVMWL